MAKKTTTQLAKDLGIPREALYDMLGRVGRTNLTPRTTVSDEEQEQVRHLLGRGSGAQVRVGAEKVRVTTTASGQETVSDLRVNTKVIRRRKTAKSEGATGPSALPLPAGLGGESLPPPPPVMPGEGIPPAPPSEIPPAPPAPEPQAKDEAPPAEAPEEPSGEPSEPSPAPEEEPAREDVAPREAPAERVADRAPEPRAAAPVRPETAGPKVLGRIDLAKTQTPAPTGPPPPPMEPGRGRADRPGGPAGKKRPKKKQLIVRRDQGDQDRFFRPGRRPPQKKRALPGREQKKTEITVPKASKRIIRMADAITVGDLAKQMGIKAGEILKKLMDLGMMATINQTIDFDTTSLIASEFDYKIESTSFDAESAIEEEHVAEIEDEANLETRPPVVTVMGHVDHGKTSLLDAIRKTDVVEGEAGGITQHIGAYAVHTDSRAITFIDTPGHEAFTAMRARGAKVTDIVILIVAADDGVMPQTVEAIHHAKAAGVPIIVAASKIDKPDADVEKVKRGLSENGLVAEDWGGDVTVVPVSAKSRDGIPELLEMIVLQAELLDLKANPSKLAKGTIIEAKLERGRGPVATVLVQEGTLRAGDPFVCGPHFGRVRAMVDDRGQRVDEAGPATPVEIIGLQGVPEAGDLFTGVKDEATARQVAEHRDEKKRDAELQSTRRSSSLDELYSQLGSAVARDFRVIIKADVQGSVEALQQALSRLSTDEAKLTVLHSQVGGVSESDVLLASASDATIIGFNVRPEPKAAKLAEREEVEIRLYRVIYEAMEDVRQKLEGLLAPEVRENELGRAEVRERFSVSGVGTIAGCMVVDGRVVRTALVRLVRDSVVVHEGRVSSLKRFKEDAREVKAGFECGIGIENFNDVKVGDVLEFFERQEIARKLEIPGIEPPGATTGPSPS